MTALLFILSGALISDAGGADAVWTFVVMGDTRDKTTDTMTGISPELPKMAEAIAGERPDFVIHTGDLANYPADRMDASDVETGYLVMRVDECAGEVTGVQRVRNRKTGRWETGDIFTLKP